MFKNETKIFHLLTQQFFRKENKKENCNGELWLYVVRREEEPLPLTSGGTISGHR